MTAVHLELLLLDLGRILKLTLYLLLLQLCANTRTEGVQNKYKGKGKKIKAVYRC